MQPADNRGRATGAEDGHMDERDADEVNYFTDRSLMDDPYPYFDHLRAACPVRREPHHGVFMVTGHEEVAAILADPATFSSCNALSGPFPGFPVPLEGDDVSELIEAHRGQLPMHGELTTMDPPTHTAHRALVARLFTPRSLSATEPFMRRLAHRLIDGFAGRGSCELISDFSGPYALLSICALLGVPESDHQAFVEEMLNPDRGILGGNTRAAMPADPFGFLHGRFKAYIEERLAEPRDDVMTTLATTPFPDGSTPDIMAAVRLASVLFIAGIDTTAGLIATAFQVLGHHGDLQALLRDDPARIPGFIEETLRLDGSVKGTFRLSRTSKEVGGVEIPAGSTTMLLVSAANRDPRKFENPAEFRIDRPSVRQHLAFGRGIHVCVGAALARAETRVAIEALLARLGPITIPQPAPGPAGPRRSRYVPTYITRNLRRIDLEFDPNETGT